MVSDHPAGERNVSILIHHTDVHGWLGGHHPAHVFLNMFGYRSEVSGGLAYRGTVHPAHASGSSTLLRQLEFGIMCHNRQRKYCRHQGRSEDRFGQIQLLFFRLSGFLSDQIIV